MDTLLQPNSPIHPASIDGTLESLPDSGLPRIDRRTFLAQGCAAAAAAYVPAAAPSVPLPGFPDRDPRWNRTWNAALAVLAGNVKVVPGYDRPVLLEGAVYPGVWQECAPQEGLVYGLLERYVAADDGKPAPLQIARNNHMAFFSLQKPDGQLPCAVKMTATGYGQIQMVVPIAATAWELVQATHDEEFLATAYAACSRWDAWLRQFRDTRKTGLTEGFCVYDTGHDNSPRWMGSPKQCPQADAHLYDHGVTSLPRLCPDLSATTYGGRVALAAMAKELGKKNEAARWETDAETIRKLILDKLYDPEASAFFDLDAQGKFVKVRSDVISRVLGEHVLKLSEQGDRAIFEAVWTRQIHNPKAFWAPFPLPSIALDDPAFVRPIPRNSWGGATQALTALRAPRWMTHYGKEAELRHLMSQWCEAISRYTEFRQQMDPLTGDFTRADASGYSPAALVYLDFIVRLQERGKGGRI